MTYHEYRRAQIKFENSLKDAGIVLISVIEKWHKKEVARTIANKKRQAKRHSNMEKTRKEYNDWAALPNSKRLRRSYYNKYIHSKNSRYDIKTELDVFVEKEIYEASRIRSVQTGFDWHVDHIVPLSKGGRHTINNLQIVPAVWNFSKGNRNNKLYKSTT